MSPGAPAPSAGPTDQSAESSESNPIRDAIAEAIAEHKVILFMKGTPEAPACGFSARTVAALQSLDTPFAAVDILPDPRIRQELTAISDWPTIPQLFVGGELLGGCDIVTEMYESGELAQTLGLEGESGSVGQVDDTVQPSALMQIENNLS
jgi:monothiol glutaredoxin